jgi:predicted Zn-dependent protease
MPSRREKIEAMLQESPQDTQLRYFLAMEFCSEGKLDEGIARLRALAEEQPTYPPACFMAAQRLVDQDEIQSARALLRLGIDGAREQGDRHAAAEMSDFLASLGERGE